MTSLLRGRLVGSAWKNGIEIFARKVGSAFVSVMMSLLPLTLTPDALAALASPAFQFISDPSGTNIVGAQALVEGAVDRVRVVRRGHRLAVRELVARADGEG